MDAALSSGTRIRPDASSQPKRLRFRRAAKLVRLVAILVSAGVEISVKLLLTPRVLWRTTRAAWLQKTCARILRLIGVRVRTQGRPPRAGLLVSNHLSYLDIIVLGAQQPMAFVSKQEVRRWPLIGSLTRLAGTIYIDRTSRRDVTRVASELCSRAAEGTVICLFPEGTSSDGSDVLPFRASLLQPAVERGWEVTPAFLAYELRDGSVADEVCYWGEMTFANHLWNLLGRESITAHVIYGGAHPPMADRKLLAARLRESVLKLASTSAQAA